MRYYISVEKDCDGFYLFKKLWAELGVVGLRADNIAEAIEKALEIETSKTDVLYFIDIVAGDIPNYLSQLEILNAHTKAPILIATSTPDVEERKEALDKGADYYGEYCETPQQNIETVIAIINSMDRRARKQDAPSKIILYGGIMIDPIYRNEIYINGHEIELFKIEFDILYLLMEHRGKTITYERLYMDVWGEEYDESAKKSIIAAIGRLRDNIKSALGGIDYIDNVRDVGYRFRLVSDK